jgi:hypothetical protein
MGNTLTSSNHNPPNKSIERASTKARSALAAMGAGDAVVVSSRLWASLVSARSSSPSIRAKNLAHEAALFSASDPKRMLTTKEAAAWIRKSPSYVYRHADELGARRVGQGQGADLLFRLGEVEAWVDQHKESRNRHSGSSHL